MVRLPLSYVSSQLCKVFEMCISCCATQQRWKPLLPLALGETRAIPPNLCASVPRMMVEHGKASYLAPLSLPLTHLVLQEAQDLLQRFLKWILLVWLWHFTQHRFVISWGQSQEGWASAWHQWAQPAPPKSAASAGQITSGAKTGISGWFFYCA